MKLLISIVCALGSSVLAYAIPTPQQGGQGGSGAFRPSTSRREDALPNHTLYHPQNIPADAKLPVLLWGNGACSTDHNDFVPFLHEIASHGYIVFANGAPGRQGSTNSGFQRSALEFILQNAGSGQYANVDATKVAVGGMSCGGIEAYDFDQDNRVATIGIFNSGLLNNYEKASRITKPIFFFIGGSSDIAYNNAERDYRTLPASTPKWKGNQNVGHGGTYRQTNGGSFGRAAVQWLDFVLKGSSAAGDWFKTNQAQSEGWQVEKAALDSIPVTA